MKKIKSISKKIYQKNYHIYIFLIFASIITFYPLLWMMISSLKAPDEIFSSPLTLFGSKLYFENYINAIKLVPFLNYIKNSAWTAILIIIIQIILSSLIAYGLTQFKFRGKNLIFQLIIATYMLPVATTYVPSYVIVAKLGLLDSLLGIIISNLGSVFMIFLLKQTFESVPKELIHYARIEGATDNQILFKVMLPLSKSTILTAGLIGFVQMYNNYLWPSLLLKSEKNYLITVGINQFFQNQGNFLEKLPILMAGNTMTVMPLLLLFIILQKFFIKGISDSGLKG